MNTNINGWMTVDCQCYNRSGLGAVKSQAQHSTQSTMNPVSVASSNSNVSEACTISFTSARSRCERGRRLVSGSNRAAHARDKTSKQPKSHRFRRQLDRLWRRGIAERREASVGRIVDGGRLDVARHGNGQLALARSQRRIFRFEYSKCLGNDQADQCVDDGGDFQNKLWTSDWCPDILVRLCKLDASEGHSERGA